LLLAASTYYAQQTALADESPDLITASINDNDLVTMAGNTRPEANAANDRGLVADSFPMDHVMLLVRRPASRETALARLIDQQSNPKSRQYHRWLSASELGSKYGPSPRDLARISGWLGAHGFNVNLIYPSGVVIDFSGTAGQVREAFHSEIHELDVNGKPHFANMSDPRIPRAIAPAVIGIASLNNLMPHPTSHHRAQYTVGGGYYLTVPADLATIYSLNPLFTSGYSGAGQTIVVVENSDVYSTADWNTFRTTFGLKTAYPNGSFAQTHPAPGPTGAACSDPGVNGDDSEAILDAEWATAAAPSATIELASCADTSTFGGFIAHANLLTLSPPPPIVSISYGESESILGAGGNAYINSLYQQAAAEGVSVFVSSGDEGAASSDAGAAAATHGVAVSGLTSTPYNVSVGGTDFGDTYAGTASSYWNAANSAVYGSALSYVPEIPWNNSCGGSLLAHYLGYSATYGSAGFCNSSTGQSYLTTVSGSGGPSGCASGTASSSAVVSGSCAGYAKPSWQRLVGNPSDGVRDIPDVSLFAANGLWGHYYVVCYSDPTAGRGGASCSGAPSSWSGFGGTSVSSPIMAGIQALANLRAGARQGNPNPVYYALAASEYGASGAPSCNSTLGKSAASSCVFYDITLGDMDVNCTGSNNCYLPSGTHGVLSTTNSAYQPAYGTNTGWDFATGIGSVNANNLVMAFGSPTPIPTPTPTPTSTPTPTPTATPTPKPTRRRHQLRPLRQPARPHPCRRLHRLPSRPRPRLRRQRLLRRRLLHRHRLPSR
jgi:subtilase family serine protease